MAKVIPFTGDHVPGAQFLQETEVTDERLQSILETAVIDLEPDAKPTSLSTFYFRKIFRRRLAPESRSCDPFWKSPFPWRFFEKNSRRRTALRSLWRP
jgi:hypothetical protein